MLEYNVGIRYISLISIPISKKNNLLAVDEVKIFEIL